MVAFLLISDSGASASFHFINSHFRQDSSEIQRLFVFVDQCEMPKCLSYIANLGIKKTFAKIAETEEISRFMNLPWISKVSLYSYFQYF